MRGFYSTPHVVPLVLFLASSLSFFSYLASFGERRMKSRFERSTWRSGECGAANADLRRSSVRGPTPSSKPFVRSRSSGRLAGLTSFSSLLARKSLRLPPRLASHAAVQLSGSLSQPSNPPLCRPWRSRRIQEGKACGPPRSWSQSRPPAVRFSGLVRRRAVFRLRLSMSSQLEQAGARLSILAPARSLSSSRLRASSAHSHASRAAPSRAAAPTRSRTRTHRARPRP